MHVGRISSVSDLPLPCSHPFPRRVPSYAGSLVESIAGPATAYVGPRTPRRTPHLRDTPSGRIGRGSGCPTVPTQPAGTQRDQVAPWRTLPFLPESHPSDGSDRGGGDRTEARRSFSPRFPAYYWRERGELVIVSNGERVSGMLYPRESLDIWEFYSSPSMRGRERVQRTLPQRSTLAK